MKNFMLSLAVSLAALATANAQNAYYFAASQEDYSDLENPTSINNDNVWDFDLFDEITIPFEFSINGEVVNRFLFEDDSFALLTPEANYLESEDGVFFVSPSSAYIQDRTYSSGVSSSPIGYTVSGTEGNHILKLEIKNAGLELAGEYGYDEDELYLSYQIWLYEADNAIEFRYGATNVSDLEVLADGDPMLAGFGNALSVGVVFGDISAPDYAEYSEANFPFDIALNGYPSNGTMYRFAPEEVAGTPVVQKQEMQLYPNPASSVLNIASGNTPISHYALYDITGKVILENKVAQSVNVSIDVQSIPAGLYFVNVDGQYLKFVKN